MFAAPLVLVPLAVALVAAKPSDSFYPDLSDPRGPLNPSYETLPHGGRHASPDIAADGSYSYCAMPHPNKQSYEKPKANNATLVNLFYIQRHQKRTAYHIFPNGEQTEYDCTDLLAFQYGSGNESATPVFTRTYTAKGNPLLKNFTSSSCQFPQLTLGGFLDGIRHGKDLREVYDIIPDGVDESVWLRSSDTPLTHYSAGGVLRGIFNSDKPIPLHVQSDHVDTHGSFSCSKRDDAASMITKEHRWLEFMNATKPIQEELVKVLQFNSSDWLADWDHYNDNFQARLCNGYELPCRDGKCVSEDVARKVFAAGDWMYNYKWIESTHAKTVIKLTSGLMIGEIIDHLKNVSSGSAATYSHLFMHDGDIAPLAASLGIKTLRWPGMASNIAIETWKTGEEYYVRVLYSGSPIRSTLGNLEWIPLKQLIHKWSTYVPKDITAECSS